MYPLTLEVSGRPVLVVGGGPVAARRAAALVAAGARVHVVAPWACEDVRDLAAAGSVTWSPREYRTGDLDGAWLVHTATGDTVVDDLVAADAERDRVWCVHAGDAGAATAWTPAVAMVDDVQVAVTAGGDPRRAVALRSAVAAALQAGDLPLRRHRRAPRADGPAGSVALVGGGPGHPDLVTVRARRLLADADVVVVDRLGPRGLLAELPDDVLVVDVGKTPGRHPVPQHEINALLVQHAQAGRRVVRLKGGDPYVFGRGGEEAQACRLAGVPVEIVPGVTSAVAVPAAAGIPVTHRGVARGFSVLTGHEELADVEGGADHTLVLLMGVTRLAQTCQALVGGGRGATTPVAVVEDGFGPGQRVTVGTLATIADLAAHVGVRAPAVVVVGDVVRLSPHWPWGLRRAPIGRGDRGRHRVDPEAGDEHPVDLDDVDREQLEVAQRRVAGPEVVQGDPDARLPDVPQHPAGTGGVVERDVLGDLQDEQGGVGPRPAQHVADRLREALGENLGGGGVDAQRKGLPRPLRPSGEVPAGLLGHPRPEL